MAKILYVLLDGVGDRPDPTLNYTTPLESAHTPALDKFARQGACGLVYPVGKGIAPESDIAVFCMLSYDVTAEYVGRGVVEAVGANMKFQDGDLALRGNFATIKDDYTIVDRRAGRDLSDEEAEELVKTIMGEVRLSHNATFNLKHTVSHRVTLVIHVDGVELSANIGNTDPAYVRVGGMGVVKTDAGVLKLQPSTPLDDSPSTKLSASLVNEFSEKVVQALQNHPVNLRRAREGRMQANAIILRDAGNRMPQIPTLEEKFGYRFVCIADLPVELGVARLTGMSVEAAGGIQDYEVKAETASRLLKEYGVVYVHLKGPDEPGHDGRAVVKKRVIEDIDQRFFSSLAGQIDLNDILLIVSSDHSTPCQLKAHSADPVPLLMVGCGVERDRACRFTERDAAIGSLGEMRGVDVLPRAFSILKRKV